MKREEKNEVLNSGAIAYYSGFGGIEIKSIEYGINDRVVFVAGAWCSARSAHKSRIDYTAGGEPFFRYHGYRIKLSECLRV